MCEWYKLYSSEDHLNWTGDGDAAATAPKLLRSEVLEIPFLISQEDADTWVVDNAECAPYTTSMCTSEIHRKRGLLTLTIINQINGNDDAWELWHGAARRTKAIQVITDRVHVYKRNEIGRAALHISCTQYGIVIAFVLQLDVPPGGRFWGPLPRQNFCLRLAMCQTLFNNWIKNYIQ